MDADRRVGYYAIKMIRLRRKDGDALPAQRIADIEARDMTEAIARAMLRYPGYMAVHGERR